MTPPTDLSARRGGRPSGTSWKKLARGVSGGVGGCRASDSSGGDVFGRYGGDDSCPRECRAFPRANNHWDFYRRNTGAHSPTQTLPWFAVAVSRATLSPERTGRKIGAQSPKQTL